MTGDPRYAYAEVRITRTYRVRVNMTSDAAKVGRADFGGPTGLVEDAVDGFELDALDPFGEPRTDVHVLAEDGPLHAWNHLHHPDHRPFVVLVSGPSETRVPADRVKDIVEIFESALVSVRGTWNAGSVSMSVSVDEYLTAEQLAAVNEGLKSIEPARAWRQPFGNGEDKRPEFDGTHVLEVSHG